MKSRETELMASRLCVCCATYSPSIDSVTMWMRISSAQRHISVMPKMYRKLERAAMAAHTVLLPVSTYAHAYIQRAYLLFTSTPSAHKKTWTHCTSIYIQKGSFIIALFCLSRRRLLGHLCVRQKNSAVTWHHVCYAACITYWMLHNMKKVMSMLHK